MSDVVADFRRARAAKTSAGAPATRTGRSTPPRSEVGRSEGNPPATGSGAAAMQPSDLLQAMERASAAGTGYLGGIRWSIGQRLGGGLRQQPSRCLRAGVALRAPRARTVGEHADWKDHQFARLPMRGYPLDVGPGDPRDMAGGYSGRRYGSWKDVADALRDGCADAPDASGLPSDSPQILERRCSQLLRRRYVRCLRHARAQKGEAAAADAAARQCACHAQSGVALPRHLAAQGWHGGGGRLQTKPRLAALARCLGSPRL
mmetsp:Transcript_146392/g.469711  ORF Transcript_146392/g.469711 Transcript_146392/m.469711 type:complete len:261 (+) Transcript_146392:137-919(+)